MKYKFENKIAVVTSAGSGLGLAAAIAFADAGATVILTDINEPVDQAKAIVDKGQKAVAIRCDVTNEREVETAIQQIISQFGRLDFAFNNAGIQSPATELADVKNEEYESILNVNLKGVWNFMKYELLQMRKQGTGVIVNNSSMGGLVGVPGRAAYHASKHGIIGLTKSAALEYAAQGIRINAVCPGTISTPMVDAMLVSETGVMEEMMKDVPIKRLGRAEEIADAVLWLCSEGSTFVIGQAIAVDGGYTSR